ncbi:MAG: aminoglycoside 3'-phosphotransferase [Oscillospiraceae bacterium]|nr:aminoglycoside 3'-phosphotransferase [Oscillospiraceae bacterium]
MEACPQEIRAWLRDAPMREITVGHSGAAVWHIDKDDGYFLKRAATGKLQRQADMTRYFHDKGLSAEVLADVSTEQDWLLTAKVPGDDCVAEKYLAQPERLCDILAERLAMLHALDFSDCPVQNHTKEYLATVERNYRTGEYDKSHFPDSYGYASADEAYAVVQAHGHELRNNTLLHGDYCLPNIMLDDWRFAGFIDLDNAGVGDHHVDVFWAIWSLGYNLKTNDYRQRFIDAYGRDKIDEDMLRMVAACEVFG